MKPDNNLVWAILSTICCCLPFGIVSIIYATQVNSLYLSGQYAAAQDSASKASKWAMIATISGVVIGVAYFLFYVLVGTAAFMI